MGISSGKVNKKILCQDEIIIKNAAYFFFLYFCLDTKVNNPEVSGQDCKSSRSFGTTHLKFLRNIRRSEINDGAFIFFLPSLLTYCLHKATAILNACFDT